MLLSKLPKDKIIIGLKVSKDFISGVIEDIAKSDNSVLIKWENGKREVFFVDDCNFNVIIEKTLTKTCENCSGDGSGLGFICKACEGRGIVPTELGSELIEFLNTYFTMKGK